MPSHKAVPRGLEQLHRGVPGRGRSGGVDHTSIRPRRDCVQSSSGATTSATASAASRRPPSMSLTMMWVPRPAASPGRRALRSVPAPGSAPSGARNARAAGRRGYRLRAAPRELPGRDRGRREDVQAATGTATNSPEPPGAAADHLPSWRRCRPERHTLHTPHGTCGFTATSLPRSASGAPAPTATTVPMNSWPMTSGGCGAGYGGDAVDVRAADPGCGYPYERLSGPGSGAGASATLTE